MAVPANQTIREPIHERNTMKAFLTATALSLAIPAQAAFESPTGFRAKILDRKDRTTVLYTLSHEAKAAGASRTAKNTFLAPDGAEVVIESTSFEGGRVTSYQQIQKQVGSDGKAEIQGGQVVFTLVKDGKTSTAKEKLRDNFVVGPSLIPYLQSRWSQVLAGKTTDVRFAVVDRKETVGFSLKKEKDVDYKGAKAVVVKMKPTSLLISALVDPLYFTLDAATGRVLELEGRVLPKRRDDGKWKDLDAVTVYEYAN